jgi:hypothetical protein
MDARRNPFPDDPDRAALWTMLVERDIAAFAAGDWSMVADDFRAEGFFGLHAGGSELPDSWRLAFPTLEVYRDEWLRQAKASAETEYAEDLAEGIHRATNLRDIDLNGDTAVCHKKFDGVIAKADGSQDVLSWQTLYFCARIDGRWKIAGFVGYMPYPMGRGRNQR